MTGVAAWREKLAASPSYKWWVLVVVQFSILLTGVDSTIVNLAMPTLAKGFEAPLSLSQWVISAYFITTAVALPAAGRLADTLGRKTVFVAGFTVFTAGSVLCGMATSMNMLIAMRMLQALGGAALLANSNAITLAIFPKHQRGLAMGINGTVYSLGYALGYTLGGYLIHGFGWRSIFYVNLPFGLIAIVIGFFVLIESRISTSPSQVKFDVPGALFSFIAIGGVMIGLERWADAGWTRSVATILAVGLSGLILFIVTELRSSSPLLDLRLFQIAFFSVGIVTRFMYNGIVASCSFLVPFYTQLVLGYSPLKSGMLMLPYSVALGICGPFAGNLSDKIGSRFITAGGFFSSAVCLYGLGALPDASTGPVPDSTLYQIVAGMAFLGATSGFFVSPNNSSTLGSVPATSTGIASGSLWCVGFLGSAIGTVFSASMLATAGGRNSVQRALHDVTHPHLLTSLVHAQSQALHILLVFSVLGGFLCLARKSCPHEPSAEIHGAHH